jgi:hypothetical protein
LSVRACLADTGFLPWLLAIGYIAVAAAQEPLLLRSFGIHLVPQTVHCAGCLVALVLASQLRLVRKPVTHVVATLVLTTLVGAVLVACLFGIELVRKGPFPSSADLWSAPEFVLIYFPAAICTSLSNGHQTSIRNVHVVVQTAFAITTSVRVSGHNWSLAQSFATMACCASAVVATAYYCKQKS